MSDLDFTTRGPPGADGNSFLWFRRDPTAADGRYGDTAININTTLVFIKDENGVWQPQFEMRGKRGVGGLPGPQGFGYLSGSAVPGSQLGRDGDFYIQDTAAGPIIYGPKAAGQWPAPDPLVPLIIGIGPPQASTGYDGQAYLDYQNAVLYGVKTGGSWPAGTTLRGLIAGSGAPNGTTGYDGQYYLDGASAALYGPKAGGMWPTLPVPLARIITGTGTPASGLGFDGQFYLDAAATALYGPKANGAWPSSPVSLIGPTPFKKVTAWASGTAYAPGPPADLVQVNGSSYACLIAHTAGSSFATDLAAGRWGLVAAKGLDGTGTGTVRHSGAPAAGRLARFSDTTGDLIEDAGVSVADLVQTGSKATAGQIRAGADDAAYITAKALADAGVPVQVPYSATITLDLTAGTDFEIDPLTGNLTLANPAVIPPRWSGTILLPQDAAGGRTISYGSAFKIAGGTPTASTAANAVDMLACRANRAGTLIRATFIKAFA